MVYDHLRRTNPTPAAAPEARKMTRPGPVGVLAGVGIYPSYRDGVMPVGGTNTAGVMYPTGGEGVAADSIRQTAEQPSPFRLSPPSHSSVALSKMPSPQEGNVQLLRHEALPILAFIPPSSHCSVPGCTKPSPQSGSATHLHALSQSSLSMRLPSSHCSPRADCTIPSPQKAPFPQSSPMQYFCSCLQREVQPSASRILPSSHSSPFSAWPFPHVPYDTMG